MLLWKPLSFPAVIAKEMSLQPSQPWAYSLKVTRDACNTRNAVPAGHLGREYPMRGKVRTIGQPGGGIESEGQKPDTKTWRSDPRVRLGVGGHSRRRQKHPRTGF